MNLFELFVKIGVKDEASKNIEGISSKLGKGLKTAAKIGTAAVGVAASGIVALTKAAVENYAEYEQLVGGVETLFNDTSLTLDEYAKSVGKSAEDAFSEWADLTSGARRVMNNAEEAFKTAGLSANEYMSTVTSFSASLLQSLGGDTDEAAKYADMAVRDMSDNANKMGTSMESIQNAYQGFAKQNYTMLDNLKLGYGGTKEEMKRLVADAAEVDSSIDSNSLSFGNIVKAINAVQKKMGIYGTTALEAEKTISGSVASTKAAWQNLITGVADDNADFEVLIDNFVESAGTVIENILPRIEKSLDGAADLVDKVFPIIIDKIPDIITKFLPKLAKSAVNIIETLVNSLSENSDELTEVALEVIITLAEGLVKFLPKLIEKAPDIIFGIVNTLIDYLPEIISVGGDIVEGIWEGIKAAAGKFTENVKEFFKGVVDSAKEVLGIHSPSTVFRDIIGKNIVLGIAEGIVKNHSKVSTSLDKTLTNSKYKLLKTMNFAQTGEKVTEQISSAIDKSKDRVQNTAKNLIKLISDTMADDKSKEQWKKTAETLANTLSNAMNTRLDKLKTSATEKISAITKSAQQSLDEIVKARSEMQNKLSGVGELFAVDEEGNVLLGNLKDQIKDVKNYSNNLSKLSQIVSDDLLSAITEMSVEDAQQYMSALLNLNEKDLRKYDALFTKKLDVSRKAAKKYYKPYIAEVKTELSGKIESIFSSLEKSLSETGTNAIEGFLKGFTNKNKKANETVKSFVNSLVTSVKKELGIKSPSRVFMGIANQMVNGLIYGWDKAIGTFEDDVTNSLEFDDGYIASFGDNNFNSSTSSGSVGRPINITQNIYAQKKSAAQLMQEARWQAQMGVLANA